MLCCFTIALAACENMAHFQQLCLLPQHHLSRNFLPPGLTLLPSKRKVCGDRRCGGHKHRQTLFHYLCALRRLHYRPLDSAPSVKVRWRRLVVCAARTSRHALWSPWLSRKSRLPSCLFRPRSFYLPRLYIMPNALLTKPYAFHWLYTFIVRCFL